MSSWKILVFLKVPPSVVAKFIKHPGKTGSITGQADLVLAAADKYIRDTGLRI